MQSWASVYRALTATGPLPTPYPVIPTSLSPISPIPHSPPASRARPDIDKHLATWLGAGSNRSQRGAPSASAGAAAAQQPRLPPCHNRDLLLYPPASESQLGSALNAGLAASAAPKSKVVQIHASAMASEPVAPPAPRAQAATPVRTPSATTPYTYGMVLGSIGQQRGPAASAEGSVRSGRTVPATAAASTDTHGEIQPAPPMQGSGMAARQGAAQQQQAGRVAHVTQPPGAAHPAALSSLQLQTAPADASWRGALKAGWKALQTVKEEMVVWPNLFTDLTTSFVHLPSETVAHVKVCDFIHTHTHMHTHTHTHVNTHIRRHVLQDLRHIKQRQFIGTLLKGRVSSRWVCVCVYVLHAGSSSGRRWHRRHLYQ